jgi:hypothetical protein
MRLSSCREGGTYRTARYPSRNPWAVEGMGGTESGRRRHGQPSRVAAIKTVSKFTTNEPP